MRLLTDQELDAALARIDFARCDDLRRDPDSEDNERFSSWYGGDLLDIARHVQASHDALALTPEDASQSPLASDGDAQRSGATRPKKDPHVS